MKHLVFIMVFLLDWGVATAQTVVAAQAIRARNLITVQDVTVLEGPPVGGVSSIEDVVGMEARVNIYAGRPISLGDVGTPAILERNALVVMRYSTGGLSISTEGRLLARASIGDRVRVMNLASRMIVTGQVLMDGTIEVGQ